MRDAVSSNVDNQTLRLIYRAYSLPHAKRKREVGSRIEARVTSDENRRPDFHLRLGIADDEAVRAADTVDDLQKLEG